MKSFRRWIILVIILCFVMSMMVACRPGGEDDEEFAANSGPGVTDPATGETIPGTTDPGTSTPGTSTPGATTPGTSTPGASTPGTSTPGATTPGASTPGTSTPGATNPGTTNPGQNPGTTNPGQNPGQNPGITNPGTSDIVSNPLMKEGKKYNNGAACSFDVDKSGFCKQGTLADLKGKTMTLYTSVDYSQFSYFNASNKSVGEWDWFKEIKRLYGVTIKYVRCTPGGSNVVKPFQAMSAGKDCDLITTHVSSFPYICNILAPLDDYCNFSKLQNSPGLDPQVTELTRWKGKNIVLGPNLVSGCWNYNSTFVKNAGLDDPYELWKAGQWNWTNYKKYMTGLPDTTAQGKTVYGSNSLSQYWYWANTNAKPCFAIDGDDPNGGIINNFDSAEVKETYIWLEGVMDAGGNYLNTSVDGSFWNTNKSTYVVMSFGKGGVDVAGILEEENKSNVYKWVPFPKNEKNAKAINHVEVYGYGIGIPRKTNKEQNRIAAAKFCELWCNRYTEARFDYLISRSKWTYDQVVEFYEFGKTNGRMGMGSGVGKLASLAGNGATASKFNQSITDAGLSVASCMAKLSNFAKQEVANVLKFGVQ